MCRGAPPPRTVFRSNNLDKPALFYTQTSYHVRLINACSENGAGFLNLVIGVRDGLEPAPT